jgi:hypothetical protein
VCKIAGREFELGDSIIRVTQPQSSRGDRSLVGGKEAWHGTGGFARFGLGLE